MKQRCHKGIPTRFTHHTTHTQCGDALSLPKLGLVNSTSTKLSAPPTQNARKMPERDYLSLIFRRCVLAILGARTPPDTTFERGMLEELVGQSEQYLSGLTDHLARLSSMQRRQKPSIEDLALMLFMNDINVVDLEKEAQMTPQMEESQPVNSLNSLHFDPEEAPLEPQSLPFFEHHQQLVPSSRQRPASIPEWMPPLPPNHTYMHTPSHSSTVRDLRHVRLQLVDEGRLAERALQRMLGDKGSASVIELKKPQANANRGAGMGEGGRLPPASGVTLIDPSSNSASQQNPVKSEVSASIPDPIQDTDADMTFASESDVSQLPPVEPHAESHTETESQPAPKPKLKFKINLPHPDPPQQESEGPKLKLSLGKPKKKKEVSVLGKRPKADILSLARNGKQRKEDQMEDDKDAFKAAMQSVR